MGSVNSTRRGDQPVYSKETAIALLDEGVNDIDRRHQKSDFTEPEDLVDKLMPGDIVQQKGNFFSKHLFYSHFAVYIGNGEIVHVTVSSQFSTKGLIKRQPLVEACEGALVRKANILDHALKPKATREIIMAARGEVNKDWDYNLITNNCEHFATLCRYGRKLSLQGLGIGDVIAGNITVQDFIYHAWISITERFETLYQWVKSKVARLGIEASQSAGAIGW